MRQAILPHFFVPSSGAEKSEHMGKALYSAYKISCAENVKKAKFIQNRMQLCSVHSLFTRLKKA